MSECSLSPVSRQALCKESDEYRDSNLRLLHAQSASGRQKHGKLLALNRFPQPARQHGQIPLSFVGACKS